MLLLLLLSLSATVWYLLTVAVFPGGASYFDMRNCHTLLSSLWKVSERQILPTSQNAFHFWPTNFPWQVFFAELCFNQLDFCIFVFAFQWCSLFEASTFLIINLALTLIFAMFTFCYLYSTWNYWRYQRGVASLMLVIVARGSFSCIAVLYLCWALRHIGSPYLRGVLIRGGVNIPGSCTSCTPTHGHKVCWRGSCPHSNRDPPNFFLKLKRL